MRNTQVIAAAAVLLLLSFGAQAEIAGVVNDIRASGCKRRAPATTPVTSDAMLDTAAGLIARGSELDAALIKSGFRATSATSINIGGVTGDAAYRCIAANLCSPSVATRSAYPLRGCTETVLNVR